MSDDVIRDYLLTISHTPLLTREQETATAIAIEVGVLARAALETADGPQRAALTTLTRDGQRAFDRMVKANLRLVVSIARKYRERGVPLEDLIQDGNIGLLRAVQGFDHVKGYRFSTYATFWIKEMIEHGITAQANVIKIPHHQLKFVSSTAKARHELIAIGGLEPHPEDVAAQAGVTVSRLVEIGKIARPVGSLNRQLGEGAELADVLIDRSAPDLLDVHIRNEEIRALHRALSALEGDEREAVVRLYGIGTEPETLPSVASRLRQPRRTVAQLVETTIQRLGASELELELEIA